jgi:hypothetical protein
LVDDWLCRLMTDSLYSLINLLLPRNLTPFMADSHKVLCSIHAQNLGKKLW